MTVGKVAFRAVEAPAPQPQPQEGTKVSFQGQEVDEEKSNASKYMIGAAALAGVVALGIAGYKGHLGEGVQKFLGGAEKAAKDASKAAEKEGSKATESVAGTAGNSAAKIEKYTAEELANINAKKISELSEAEINKAVDSVMREDLPVLKEYTKWELSNIARKDMTFEEHIKGLNKVYELNKEIYGEEFIMKLFKQDGLATKKMGDIKLKEVIELYDSIPADKFNLLKSDVKNRVTLFKKFGEEATYNDYLKALNVPIPFKADKSLIENKEYLNYMIFHS